MSRNGRHAVVWAKDVCLVDTFQFASPFLVPATADIYARWHATGPGETLHESDSPNFLGIPPSSPFLAKMAPARSVGRFSGEGLGFSYWSRGRATSDRTYATLGHGCNGVFLKK